MKRQALAQVGRCLEWLANMSDEFMQAFSNQEDALSRRHCKIYFSLLACILATVPDLGSLGKSWSMLKNSLASHFRTTYNPTIRALIGIGTNAEMKQFVRNLDSPDAKELLAGPLVSVSCSQVKDEDAAFAELDAAWVTEIKQKATITFLERTLIRLAVAKKDRSGRFLLKASPRVTDPAEYVGLTSVAIRSGIKRGDCSGQILPYWRAIRAKMRLYASLTKN